MHIVRFEAQNIQRLQAVTIEPGADSPAVVLAGGNEEGKSSCLDAIEMALAGEKVIPPEPIRRGQDKAHVVVDLGDMIVTRRYTAKGTSLTVTNREGLKYPSPQALLDGLYDKLTFDPMAFATADPPKQAATLRTLANVNTTDLDNERGMVFATRTEVNRDLAKAKAILEKAPVFDDVTEAQDAAAIVAKLEDAERLSNVVTESANLLTRARERHATAEDRCRRADSALELARQALQGAEKEAAAAAGHLEAMSAELAQRTDEHRAAQQAVPDTSDLRKQLAGVQEHNRKVEANQRRSELATDVEQLQQTANGHTARLEAIDKEKADRLAAAKFPVEGLGIDDNGVTWNGLPFEQASTAIRTRVSAAIGFALNPKLRILLVRNGNDLDGKNLKLLADAAAEAGGQVWVERIAGGEGLQTVVIEDGAVKGAAPVEPEEPQATATSPADPAPKGSTDVAPGPKSPPPARARVRRPGSAPGLFEGGKAK